MAPLSWVWIDILEHMDFQTWVWTHWFLVNINWLSSFGIKVCQFTSLREFWNPWIEITNVTTIKCANKNKVRVINLPLGKSTSSRQEDLISRSEWVLEAQPRITEMTFEVVPSWQTLLLDCFHCWLLKLFSWKSARTAADICWKKRWKI